MLVKINGFPITSGFGAIDTIHNTPHKGIDFAMPVGTPLQAVGDSVVQAAKDQGAHGLGKFIALKLNDGTQVIYGHLSAINVKVGQHVQDGDIIGYSGNSGFSSGPHLHFQVTSAAGILADPTKGALIPEMMRRGTEKTLDTVSTGVLHWIGTSGVAILGEVLLVWGMICLLMAISGSSKWLGKGVMSLTLSLMIGTVGK